MFLDSNALKNASLAAFHTLDDSSDKVCVPPAFFVEALACFSSRDGNVVGPSEWYPVPRPHGSSCTSAGLFDGPKTDRVGCG